MINIAMGKPVRAGEQAMAEIESDGDLLRHLDLSETEAANFLYRTRQTVNQSLARGEPYFKPHEILALRLAAASKAQSIGGNIDKYAVGRYVERSWGQEAATQVMTGYGRVSDTLEPTEYEELWVVLPDPGHLISTLRAQADFLKRLPTAAPRTAVVYMFGSELEERAFKRKMAYVDGSSAPNVTFIHEALIAAQLTMVIGNPRSLDVSPEVWVLAEAGFQRAIHVKAEIASQYLQDSVSELRDLPAVFTGAGELAGNRPAEGGRGG